MKLASKETCTGCNACAYICPKKCISFKNDETYDIAYPVIDETQCINCGKCKKVCQMNIDPVENCNHLECIRCGRCKNACPVDAISYGVRK